MPPHTEHTVLKIRHLACGALKKKHTQVTTKIRRPTAPRSHIFNPFTSAASDGLSHRSSEHQRHHQPVSHLICVSILVAGMVQRCCCCCSAFLHTPSQPITEHMCFHSSLTSLLVFLTMKCPVQSTSGPKGRTISTLCSQGHVWLESSTTAAWCD